MPLGGENIGRAYISILADGSGLEESIRDSFKSEDDVLDQQGKRGGKRYTDAFAEYMESTTTRTKLQKAFTNSLARNDVLDGFLRGQNWNQFRDRLGREFGEAGDLAGKRLEQDLIKGMSFEGLDARIGNLTREVARATSDIQKEQDRVRAERMKAFLAEAVEMNKAYDREVLQNRMDADKQWELQIADLARQSQEAEAQRQKDIKFRITLERAYSENARRDLAEQRRMAAKLGQDFALLNREAAQLLKGDKNAQSRSKLLELVGNIREGMERLNITNSVWNETLRDTDRDLRRVHPGLNRFILNMDRTSNSIGRAFGKGSRNDFLNFIGGITGGIFRLVPTLGRMARGVSNFGVSMGEAARSGRLLQFTLGTLGKGFAGLAGLTAGVFGIIGPIMSIFSQLAGVVVALAANLTFSLGAALGAIPALVLPAVGGIGTLALAFYDLDKAQKAALKNDIRPVTQAFANLADVARGGLFDNLANQSTRFGRVIDSISPIVRGIGESISSIADRWLDSLRSPSFLAWRDTMADFLPGAIEDLGRIAGNVFSGFGGLFRGMTPFMADVLDYLVRLTDRFAEWSHSLEGQNDIVRFFVDAKDSISAFGDFLGSTRDLLVELISAGRGAGDSLFGSMSRAIDGWVEKIRANPDILRDWFDSAESFGRVIGNLAVGLGKVFDALDNQFSRSAATFAFDTLAAAINGVADVLSGFGRLLGVGEDAMLGFAGQAAAAAIIFPRLSGAIGNMGSGFSGFIGQLRAGEGRLAAFKTAAGGLAGAAGLGGLIIGMQQTNDAARVLMTSLGGAAAGFSVGGPWGALIGGTLGAAMGIFADESREVSSALSAAREPAVSFADSLNQVSGAATKATNDLILMRLEQLDALAPARALGIAQRDLVGYMKGNEGAIQRVNRAMRGSGEAVQWTTDQYGNLTAVVPKTDANISALANSLGITTKELRQQAMEARANALATENLNKVFKGVPDRVITKMRTDGVPTSVKDVARLTSRFDLVPKDIKTILTALNVAPTNKNIQSVINKAKELDKQRPTPTADANTKPLDGKIKRSESELERLARVRAVSEIDGDPKPLDGKIAGSRRDLDALGRVRSVPSVDLNTSPLYAGIANVVAALNRIPDEQVNINVTRTERTLTTPSERRGASGGILSGGEHWLTAEAGREALVPLQRPLGEIDPSVRWLAAIAQGKVPFITEGGPSKTVELGGVTVVSKSDDPYAVAHEVINAIAGASL